MAAAVCLATGCGPTDRSVDEIELFEPTSMTWSVEAPYITQGEDARFFVELTWDRPIPDDVIVQLPEEDGCYFQDCSVEWEGGGRERATVTVRTSPLPGYDTANFRFAQARVAGTVRVCTLPTPRRCIDVSSGELNVNIGTGVEYVSFPDEEVTLAVGERRAIQATPQGFSPRYGRHISRLMFSEAEVTYENLADGILRLDEDGVLEAIAAPGEGFVRASVGGVSAMLRVRTVPAEEARPLPPDGFHPYPANVRPWGLYSSSTNISYHQHLVAFTPEGAPIAVASLDRVQDGAEEYIDSFGPIVLRRWTGTGWSHELVTTPAETPHRYFVAVGGDAHVYIGFFDLEERALTLLDRRLDAPPASPWRRRTSPPWLDGAQARTELPPEVAVMPSPDGLWLALHVAVGANVRTEEESTALVAAGITSNCVRLLRLEHVSDTGFRSELVERQNLVPVSLSPDTVKHDWDCEDVIRGLNGQHNASRVYMGPAPGAADLSARPVLVTETFGSILGNPWLGFTEILIDEDYDPLFSVDGVLGMMQVHRHDGAAWSSASLGGGPEDLTAHAGRALTWSPGVAIDDPLFDDANWRPFPGTRLRPGVSVAGQGAWLIDTNLPFPQLVRHILPWGGEARDSLMSRTGTGVWESHSLNNPGTGEWASLTAGHGTLALVTNYFPGWQNTGERRPPGIWIDRPDLRLPSPASSLATGMQTVGREELTRAPVYENETLIWGGSAPPVYTQAAALTGGRVALLGPDANPWQRDLVQVLGPSGVETPTPLPSPCAIGEGTLVGGADAPRFVCVRVSPGSDPPLRLVSLDITTEAVTELATAPRSGYAAAAASTPDGSVWAILGADLLRFAPGAGGVTTETHPLPALLEPSAATASETPLHWGLWPDGDGLLVVRNLPQTDTLTRTLAFWRWTPAGGFEAPWTATLTSPGPSFSGLAGLGADPARGAVVGGRFVVTTQFGPYVSMDGRTFTHSPLDGALPPAARGVFGERATGVVRLSDGRVAWIEESSDAPGTQYVAVRTSSDGVTWSAPQRALDTRSGFQIAWAAAGTTDGALVLYVGDSRSFGVRDPATYRLGTYDRERIAPRNMPLLHGTAVRLALP